MTRSGSGKGREPTSPEGVVSPQGRPDGDGEGLGGASACVCLHRCGSKGLCVCACVCARLCERVCVCVVWCECVWVCVVWCVWVCVGVCSEVCVSVCVAVGARVLLQQLRGWMDCTHVYPGRSPAARIALQGRQDRHMGLGGRHTGLGGDSHTGWGGGGQSYLAGGGGGAGAGGGGGGAGAPGAEGGGRGGQPQPSEPSVPSWPEVGVGSGHSRGSQGSPRCRFRGGRLHPGEQTCAVIVGLAPAGRHRTPGPQAAPTPRAMPWGPCHSPFPPSARGLRGVLPALGLPWDPKEEKAKWTQAASHTGSEAARREGRRRLWRHDVLA